MALIGGVVGVAAFLLIAAVLVLGFWEPGFFRHHQAGRQQGADRCPADPER